MMYPLVTDLADEGIPVAVTCRVLGFSRQGYFKWRVKPVCDRDLSDANLINDAIDAHHDDPGFGYRFISDELEALGHQASENRVQRLCSLQRIFSVHSKKRGTGRKPGPPVHDDLLQRDFTAKTINEKWLTDISEHPTGEGKLYLCAIKDACSKRIVGYSMDAHMPAALAVNALNNALITRGTPDTIVHSDRGSQGEFNWPSQHLNFGGVQCATRTALRRFACIGDTSLLRDGPAWLGERTGSSSGRPSLAA
jgi:putative transposase